MSDKINLGMNNRLKISTLRESLSQIQHQTVRTLRLFFFLKMD